MFICSLAGGLAISITIGIVDVLFVQADAVKTQGSVSASVDLALGLCLLVSGRVMRFSTSRSSTTRSARLLQVVARMTNSDWSTWVPRKWVLGDLIDYEPHNGRPELSDRLTYRAERCD